MKGLTVRDIAEICGGRILRGNPEGMPCRISTDSREELENALFVPVIGERTDGHKYLCQVAEKGAAAAFTSEGDPFADDAAGIPESFALIAVDDTVKALQDLGAGCRKLHPIPLVGVTGSVGKTSTREIIAAALSAGKKVFRTKGNHNSQIGVPITLSELSGEDEIGVIEMGMSNFGEMSRLSRMVRPDAAVFTNVGEAHLEILGSKENIRSEKLHIQDCMPEQAVLFVNGDDPLLRDCPLREGVRRVRYGTSEGCDVRAVNIDLSHGRPKFEVLAGEERIPVSLNVYGMHHVLNASAALAVAKDNVSDIGRQRSGARALDFHRNTLGRSCRVARVAVRREGGAVVFVADDVVLARHEGTRRGGGGDALRRRKTAWRKAPGGPSLYAGRPVPRDRGRGPCGGEGNEYPGGGPDPGPEL